jgi:hypothetical protein
MSTNVAAALSKECALAATKAALMFFATTALRFSDNEQACIGCKNTSFSIAGGDVLHKDQQYVNFHTLSQVARSPETPYNLLNKIYCPVILDIFNRNSV